jgi:galactitol-specific phosphotransferase system IIB component
MKKTLAAALLALSLAIAACGSNAASSVPGTYELDKAHAKEQILANMDAETKKKMAGMIDNLVDAMGGTAELKADGTMTMTSKNPTGNQVEQGTWKLDGDKLTMTTTQDGKPESHTGTWANGTITMTVEGEGKKMQLLFKKK